VPSNPLHKVSSIKAKEERQQCKVERMKEIVRCLLSAADGTEYAVIRTKYMGIYGILLRYISGSDPCIRHGM
jgi:hypothetical protein